MITKQRRAIRIEEVQAKTGLSRSSIYALEKAPDASRRLPAHFKISERLSGWWEHEIDAYLEARASSTRQAA